MQPKCAAAARNLPIEKALGAVGQHHIAYPCHLKDPGGIAEGDHSQYGLQVPRAKFAAPSPIRLLEGNVDTESHCGAAKDTILWR